jgi:hypothetical protein
MPEDGIVIIGFISDRAGTNNINYTVKRLPASDAVQDYNTKVVWQAPPNGKGGRVAVRAEQ